MLRTVWELVRRRTVLLNSCTLMLCLLIITATLLPVFRASRESARIETCQINIKAQVDALRLYSEDWDETMPQANRWMDSISVNSTNDPIFHCRNAASYGYTLNSDLAGQNRKHVKDLAQTPLVYEGRDLGKNAYAPGLSGLAYPLRHGLGVRYNYVGYLDGSFKPYPPIPKVQSDK